MKNVLNGLILISESEINKTKVKDILDYYNSKFVIHPRNPSRSHFWEERKEAQQRTNTFLVKMHLSQIIEIRNKKQFLAKLTHCKYII